MPASALVDRSTAMTQAPRRRNSSTTAVPRAPPAPVTTTTSATPESVITIGHGRNRLPVQRPARGCDASLPDLRRSVTFEDVYTQGLDQRDDAPRALEEHELLARFDERV